MKRERERERERERGEKSGGKLRDDYVTVSQKSKLSNSATARVEGRKHDGAGCGDPFPKRPPLSPTGVA